MDWIEEYRKSCANAEDIILRMEAYIYDLEQELAKSRARVSELEDINDARIEWDARNWLYPDIR
jgi:hypothetical protein